MTDDPARRSKRLTILRQLWQTGQYASKGDHQEAHFVDHLEGLIAFFEKAWAIPRSEYVYGAPQRVESVCIDGSCSV